MGEENYAPGDRVGRYYSESPTAENIGWRDLGPFYGEREIVSTLVQVLQGAEELFRANRIKGVYLDGLQRTRDRTISSPTKSSTARWQDAGADRRRRF
jgi:hypothetical protein